MAWTQGLVGASLLLATGVAAAAEVETSRAVSERYIGILGSYSILDEARDDTIDWGGGFNLLYGVGGSGLGFEVSVLGDAFETTQAGGADFYRLGAGIDLTYSFGDRASFTPFFVLGGGAFHNDVVPNSEDDWSWFLQGGVGFVTGPFTDYGALRLRGEARYIYDDYAEGFGDVRFGLGVEIPLFRTVTVLAGTETVRVVEVSTGLTDEDGDGVIDSVDQCPNTPPGTRVDGNGCPLQKVIALDGVTFEFNSARLQPNAKGLLNEAQRILQRYPDMQIEVAGHTDSVGNDAYNLKLSQQRADAVRDYFLSEGVPAERLTSKGYGEAEPVADNETAAGRELNRRVELRVLN
ncbi:MAG TPA: OmpA family protein [Solimonas sp.]